MHTEGMSARYVDLDSWSTVEMITAMYEAQLAAVAAVGPSLDAIAAAADHAVSALRAGGRLVYVGAGTSGRIGVQDGAELTPTFNWPAERVVFLIAGGFDALLRSSEGAEDHERDGVEAINGANVGASDVVIGIAASGTTPYTVAALRAASATGAVTIAIANTPGSPLLEAAQHKILAKTGAEVVAGSTRMKAGTAQKVVLNLLSTSVMTNMGGVYRGLMVDMRARNAKLMRRAATIVSEIAGCSKDDAADYLVRTDGDLKTAILLGRGVPFAEAAKLLIHHGGNLRSAIAQFQRDNG
jgi:N-acetylmuramic acid 6-phosphate etherase